MQLLTCGIAAVLLSILASAHPGHNPSQDTKVSSDILAKSKQDLTHCSTKLETRRVTREIIDRRLERMSFERQKRGLPNCEQSSKLSYICS